MARGDDGDELRLACARLAARQPLNNREESLLELDPPLGLVEHLRQSPVIVAGALIVLVGEAANLRPEFGALGKFPPSRPKRLSDHIAAIDESTVAQAL
jgi:hypothetical protein